MPIENRTENEPDQVRKIPINELVPFKDHPFKVVEDESMLRTTESISMFGVLTPLIARPTEDGKYEIISGHRRAHAAEAVGLTEVPVIVRDMDDDVAKILVVDSNLQRENILPSERAFAYKMKADAIPPSRKWRLHTMYGLTKYEKETIILTNEADDFYEVYTFNSALKKKLAAYAKRHPDLCSLKETTKEGSATFVVDKARLSLRLMVAVRRPGGETVMQPFEVRHTQSDLTELVARLKGLDGDIRVVMEHTGTYWQPIAMYLKKEGFFVSVVNALLIHDFTDNSLRKVKTDKADSMKIANYALAFWSSLRELSAEDEIRQQLKAQRQSQGKIGVISAPICAFYHRSLGGFSVVSVQTCPLQFRSGSKLGQGATLHKLIEYGPQKVDHGLSIYREHDKINPKEPKGDSSHVTREVYANIQSEDRFGNPAGRAGAGGHRR